MQASHKGHDMTWTILPPPTPETSEEVAAWVALENSVLRLFVAFNTPLIENVLPRASTVDCLVNEGAHQLMLVLRDDDAGFTPIPHGKQGNDLLYPWQCVSLPTFAAMTSDSIGGPCAHEVTEHEGKPALLVTLPQSIYPRVYVDPPAPNFEGL
jgi:hypothetical protein